MISVRLKVNAVEECITCHGHLFTCFLTSTFTRVHYGTVNELQGGQPEYTSRGGGRGGGGWGGGEGGSTGRTKEQSPPELPKRWGALPPNFHIIMPCTPLHTHTSLDYLLKTILRYYCSPLLCFEKISVINNSAKRAELTL